MADEFSEVKMLRTLRDVDKPKQCSLVAVLAGSGDNPRALLCGLSEKRRQSQLFYYSSLKCQLLH